jgi:hypothetical protein
MYDMVMYVRLGTVEVPARYGTGVWSDTVDIQRKWMGQREPGF